MAENEIERENKELRKEVEALRNRLNTTTMEKQIAEKVALDHQKAVYNTGANHARYHLTIKGLIEFIKNMNQLMNNIQIMQAELQAQIIAVLKLTQPYFNQEVEQIVTQVVDAQIKQSQQQLDHSKKSQQQQQQQK